MDSDDEYLFDGITDSALLKALDPSSASHMDELDLNAEVDTRSVPGTQPSSPGDSVSKTPVDVLVTRLFPEDLSSNAGEDEGKHI
jgi:hypothetical protein